MRKQKKISISKKHSPLILAREGFTLIELLIVMAIITIMMAAVMGSLSNSRYTAAFFTAEEKLTSFLRTARTYAITGKSVTDVTDFDGDADYTDQVTPAGFGVAFSNGGRIVLFADMHADKASGIPAEKSFQDLGVGQVGVYDPLKRNDLILDEYQIDTNLVTVTQPDAGGTPITAVMYSPIFADTSFQGALPSGKAYLNLQVASTMITSSKHCFWIQPIAGNPEPMPCT